jgi:hypothetical protein
MNRHVRQMADNAPIDRAWNLRISAIRQDLSPGLNAALEPILARFAVLPRPGRRQAPARRANFDHRHIPHRLPDAWFAPFLGKLPTAGAGPLRRAAAITLVRLVEGGTYAQARHLLGIPATLTTGTSASTAWLRDNADAFTSALNDIADHLDASTNLVDYGNRRQQLANWSIPVEQWVATAHEHSEQSRGNHRAPDWGDDKRRFVCWMVWTAVTSSERLFAPTSILPAPKSRSTNDDRDRIVNYWHQLHRASRPHRHRLTEIINRYTEQTITAAAARIRWARPMLARLWSRSRP